MTWPKCGHPRTLANTSSNGKQCQPCKAAAQARYRITAKGRATGVRYATSEKCRETTSRYWRSDAGQIVQDRYRYSVKGIKREIRCNAERRGTR